MDNKCDWKELQINKVPEDILMEIYQWEYIQEYSQEWKIWQRTIQDLIYCLLEGNYKFRYRKLEKNKTAKEKAIHKFAHEMINTKNSMDVFEQGRIVVETIEAYLKYLPE